MLKQVLTTSLALTSVLLGAGQAMAGSFFIDNFSSVNQEQDIVLIGPSSPPTPYGVLFNDGPNPDLGTGLTPPSSVIGGSRRLGLQRLSASNDDQQSRARVTGGNLAITNDTGVISQTTLLWDNNGAGLDAAGQGNFLDKLGTSTGRFGINFKPPTVGTFDAIINIKDSSGLVSEVSVNNLAASTTHNQFLLSDFIANNSLINLNSVRYIELVLKSSAGGSVDIADIGLYEIPEPSALAGSIFALGLGVTFLRRRQENND
jgi:hypothetical protein